MSTTPIDLKAPASQTPYRKNGKLFVELLDEKKHPETLFLERIVLLGIIAASILTPGMLFRSACGRYSQGCRKKGIEVYALFKLILAFIILFGDKGQHWFPSLVLSTYLLVDLFSNLFALVLLRNFWSAPISLNRSLILLAFNFVEFNAWFACIYLYWAGLREAGEVVKEPLTALYFSVVSSTTLGYGDIVPHGGTRWIAIFHIMLSFGFLAVVVAYFVGTLSDKTGLKIEGKSSGRSEGKSEEIGEDVEGKKG